MRLLFLLVFSFVVSPMFGQDSIQFTTLYEFDTTPNPMLTSIHDSQGRPFIYSANNAGGFWVLEISDQDLLESTHFPIDSFNNQNLMNLTQEGDYLYIPIGNFFAAQSTPPGLAIINVKDPKNPIIEDIWQDTVSRKGSAVVEVQGDYAFLGAMNYGLIILDISDKNNIQFTSHLLPDRDFPVENPNSVQEPNARGMDISGDIMMLCFDAGGIRSIDISDKENPREIGIYINEQALTTQQAYNNIWINGDIAYAAVDYCGLEVLDISDPQNVTRINWWNPFECEIFENTWFEAPIHTNQVSYDSEKELVFLSAGDSELVVVDVSDPMDLQQIGQLGMAENLRAAWGASIFENRVVLSYINAVIPFVSFFNGEIFLGLDMK